MTSVFGVSPVRFDTLPRPCRDMAFTCGKVIGLLAGASFGERARMTHFAKGV